MQKINSESTLKVSLRLQRAYLKARAEQDLVEVDLNRARIILVDKNGKLIKELHKNEH
ncbi:hypothetical protein [Vibrio sp. VB16]|uniref:hypothetical protein n=1 Tax=Vibrio sp. VB16 TaxID=2785746 RepID=UPI0018A0B222|nr:hypothetical protein [Vibrio sp. VB16]UGA57185.1 hypothetical protein IUZ65_016910 [Vibrio sp. VB16]